MNVVGPASLAPLKRGCLGNGSSCQPVSWSRSLKTKAAHRKLSTDREAARQSEKDFQRELILSVLQSQPSPRDTRVYLNTFSPTTDRKDRALRNMLPETPAFPVSDATMPTTAFARPFQETEADAALASGKTPLADELMQPVHRHTALVKIQGPFTDRQLESIAEGMVYLKKLGLVSIIVLDHEEWTHEEEALTAFSHEDRQERICSLRESIKAETLRLADMLEAKGGEARPLLDGVLSVSGCQFEKTWTPVASTSAKPYDAVQHDLFVDSLSGIRDAIRRGEIPIIPPLALDSSCFSLCVSANDAFRAISSGLADHEKKAGLRYDSDPSLRNDVDLTPVRLMIINREGGIPSPARDGNPHLSINLESEFNHIKETFIWHESHPTSLSNLAMLRDCLNELPRTASAVVVSHRSPRSLVGNLITNKPAHSPSLHFSLLAGRDVVHQPTIVRRGLPLRVVRNMDELDIDKLTTLLEASFGKVLDAEPFYARLKATLDFCIVAGDYQGVAIVTNEQPSDQLSSPSSKPVSYLDKFAVLPSLQGDGTVDFLWGALRDESFGLGVRDALNPNVGGLKGQGEGKDLVWRSRADNPVNKWYYERSNGFFKIPPPKGSPVGFALFWCEAEDKAAALKRGEGESSAKRLKEWSKVVGAIPSCWKPAA